ncbi:MAG: right-handed parallel beta-helix repeat-containing protein [Paludibacter sp.]|nr:right-handed parallel beta-helix repeat-containing protein [Paludibacter sp.]
MKRFNLLFFLIAVVATLHATVYYVSPTGSGSDGLSWATAYASPAAALAGSPVAGDEVWVKQGTYVSATTLNWKTGINFYGGFAGTETERSQRSMDASLTILEGNNTNRVLNAPAMASATTWSGFTIQKGLSSGGGAGIFMQRNAILDNCIVQNNKDTNWGGAGIYIQGGDLDSIKVINCIVQNNITTSTDTRTDKHGGGGIRIRPDASKAVIRNCTIENNIVDGLAGANSGVSGGGVYMAAGKLENSIVRNNTATNKNASTQALTYSGKCQGGGVFIMPQANSNTIVIKNCTITGNAANTSLGGGISIDPLWTSATITSPVLIANNFITNNSAYRTGGGIMTDGQQTASTATYTFENCVIANNESSSVAAGGGGAFINNILGYAGAISFINCTVVNNKMLTTNYGGAGIFYNNVQADVTNCVFWGNGSVGTLAPYHVRVRTTLTTNKLIHCAFDDRFVESQVSPVDFEADLTGKVIIDQTNSGSTGGVFYADFVSPTNFIGKAVTGDDITSLNAANWATMSTSALVNAGKTILSITTDITGTERPQSTGYDIGAYEFNPGPSTNTSAFQKGISMYGNNGTVFIQNDGDINVIQIFNVMGKLMVSLQAKEGMNEIVLPANQLYIVKAGSKSQKIML